MCSPNHKGHDDLTSSPPSSGLSPAVSSEFPSYCWLLTTRVALVAGLNPTSHDTSWRQPCTTCIPCPEGLASLQDYSRVCQDLVRFFALLRIKPHAPPLVRVPVNSFEFHSCERTPQVEYLMRLLAAPKSLPPRHQVFIVYCVDYQGI